MSYLVPIHQWPICPISALCSKFNPRNINYMPAVKFIARLNLDPICLFLDRHYLATNRKVGGSCILSLELVYESKGGCLFASHLRVDRFMNRFAWDSRCCVAPNDTAWRNILWFADRSFKP